MPDVTIPPLERITKTLYNIRRDLRELLNRRTHTINLSSLGDEHLALISPIQITIEAEDEDFTATWLDANIAAGGDSATEAVANLQSWICDFYEILSGVPAADLGPGPRRQLATLREFVRAKDQVA